MNSVEQRLLPFLDLQHISWWSLVLLLAGYVSLRACVLQGGFYAWLKTRGQAVRQRVYQMPFAKGQIAKELRASIAVIIFDAILIATTAKALAKFSLPGQGPNSFLVTFSIAFVWFEIWFYVSHRMLHHKNLYFIHRQHHTARVTSPLTALSFSVLERFIILAGGTGGMALLSFWYPVSYPSLASYLLLNYLLNVFGHSNIEVVPPRWQANVFGRSLNPPTYHALHHSRLKGHYGLFTPYMDRIFATRFKDYEAIQEKAYHGEGLTSLSQRLAPGPSKT